MTFGDLLHLARRHWVGSVLVVAMVVVAAAWGFQRHEAYNGEVTVLLLAPAQADKNALASTTASLIATTGVVAGLVNGPGPEDQTVGGQTLASVGIKRGWTVQQPNSGGQWESSFQDPLLDVRSTGPTLDVAQQQMTTALDRVDAALVALQDAQGVRSDERIRTVLNPDEPVYLKQSGSRVRALGGIGILGLLAWTAVLFAAERLRPVRERRVVAVQG